MKRKTDIDLIDCIAFLQAELKALPPMDYRVAGSREAHAAAVAAMVQRIEDRWPGAKIRRAAFDGLGVSLAGVRSTSTSGTVGAIQNWIKAARRRLDQTGFIQTSGEKERV